MRGLISGAKKCLGYRPNWKSTSGDLTEVDLSPIPVDFGKSKTVYNEPDGLGGRLVIKVL